MWHIDSDVGTARWLGPNTDWRVRGTGESIGIWEGPTEQACCRFEPVECEALPVATEQFVRGDQWHVHHRQGTGLFGLHLVYRPVVDRRQVLTGDVGSARILEVTLAIQTSLLDSRPKVDLRVDGVRGRTMDPDLGLTVGGDPVNRVEPINEVAGGATSVIVLLATRDCLTTENVSDRGGLRLRLFGDFLEKGVIRKARVWIVTASSMHPPADPALVSLWRALGGQPLPLEA